MSETLHLKHVGASTLREFTGAQLRSMFHDEGYVFECDGEPAAVLITYECFLRIQRLLVEAKNTLSKNPDAVALGRLGGKLGGEARAKALSIDRRKEIASKAARARWAKR